MNGMELQKIRTKGSARAILEDIEGLELSDLLADIFVWSENENAKYLIKAYESQIILAYTDKDEFTRTLHSFYKTTARHIRINHLEKEFLLFTYFVYSSMARKEKRSLNSLRCYLDTILQQYNYFVLPPNMVYGLTNDGNWLITKEPYPNIDVAVIELAEYKKKYKKFPNWGFEKYGYNIKSLDDLNFLHLNEQLVTNQLLIMTPFINEHTEYMTPKNHFALVHGADLPKIVTPTSFFKKMLNEKRYFLPNKGLHGVYKNALYIGEIYFHELFFEDRLILLYKVVSIKTMDERFRNKEFSGFYDNRLELFFSPWREADKGAIFHDQLENFVLESYCYLTTDIDELEESESFRKRLIVEKDGVIIESRAPSVRFIYDKEGSHRPADTEKGSRLFDKRKYREEKMQFGGRTRKLAWGTKASDEAIQLARQYGYIVNPGETFVRPYERVVYKNKE